MHLKDFAVKERRVGPLWLVVRANSVPAAGRMADDTVLTELANIAGKLTFRPEIQIRGHRLIAYLADRNASVDDAETLKELVEFIKNAVSV